jgi:hypothetical protein
MSDRIIATIRKNSREEIRVTRGDFKGHDIIGVRVWFEDRGTGEMRPGKDGIALVQAPPGAARRDVPATADSAD